MKYFPQKTWQFGKLKVFLHLSFDGSAYASVLCTMLCMVFMLTRILRKTKKTIINNLNS